MSTTFQRRGLDQEDAEEIERRKAEVRAASEAMARKGIVPQRLESKIVRHVTGKTTRARQVRRPPVLVDAIHAACERLADPAGVVDVDKLMVAVGKDPKIGSDRVLIREMLRYLKNTRKWDFTVVFRAPGWPKGQARKMRPSG